MSGNTGQSGTTVSSVGTGLSSDSLSAPFIAVSTGGGPRSLPAERVVEPEGSSHLTVRRSARVASSRSRSLRASESNPSLQDIIAAPPGVRRRPGYAYRALPSVDEEPGHSVTPGGSAENEHDLRDVAIPQVDPLAGNPGTSRSGRKRAASSAASGSGRPAPRSQPQPLASARDFSPTHFDEPLSDGIFPSPQQSVQQSAPRSFQDVVAQFSPLNAVAQGDMPVAPLSPFLL
jgi:hypothetical protein